MSSCNKRVGGGAGRSKLGGTSFLGSHRSDLLKSHYLSLVLFGDDGLPVNPSLEKFFKLIKKN